MTRELRLTRRQIEICALAMQGLRYREISERTGIPVMAVGNTIARAKMRMGARTVRQLMAMLGREMREEEF